MKMCASIRFGGQLIEATDCDYDTFDKYGLICPECKNSVFLVKQTQRKVGDKSVQVAAHFSHFKQHLELAKECELRIQKYSASEIAKAKEIARGQRQKFFERWFWNCVLSQHLVEEKEKTLGDIAKLHHNMYAKNRSYIQKMDAIYDVVKSFFKSESRKNESIDLWIKAMISRNFDTSHWGEDLPAHIEQIIDSFNDKIEVKMHELICKEAIEFALTPRNRPQATALMFGSCLSIFMNLSSSELFNDDGLNEEMFEINFQTVRIHVHTFILYICLVPWAQEFVNKREVKNED